MAIVIPEGECQATFVFTVAGKASEMCFTLGFHEEATADLADECEVIRDIWSGPSGVFRTENMGLGYTFVGVRAVKTVGGEPLQAQAFNPTTGTGTGAPLPPNCALLVRKNTAAGGRRNRGRMYVPPCLIGETKTSAAGIYDDLMVTAFNTEFNLMRQLMDEQFVPPTLLHEDGGPPTPITSFSVQSLIATQRRRVR